MLFQSNFFSHFLSQLSWNDCYTYIAVIVSIAEFLNALWKNTFHQRHQTYSEFIHCSFNARANMLKMMQKLDVRGSLGAILWHPIFAWSCSGSRYSLADPEGVREGQNSKNRVKIMQKLDVIKRSSMIQLLHQFYPKNMQKLDVRRWSKLLTEMQHNYII